jgi:Response regulator containing CheY-like receiver domain and AraC-type DNA-binding domain
MIKVLIADDRDFERQRLKSVVNWQLYGIDIIGEARNGREAFNLCLNLKPEILITDIKMPIMDGIELARALSSALPTLKIIFLTAYSDFEYTRNAIELNVCGYILKPYTEKDITDSIGRALDEISDYSYRKKKEEEFNSMFEGNLSTLREAFLYEMITSTADISEKNFWNKANFLGIQFNYDLFVMLMIRARFAPNSKKEIRNLRIEMDQIINSAVSRYCKTSYTILDSTADIIVLLNIDDELPERETQNLISMIVSALHNSLSEHNYSVHINSSTVGHGFKSWNRLYSQVARNTANIGSDIDRETVTGIFEKYKEVEPEIFAALKQGQGPYAFSIVKTIIEYAASKGFVASHLLKICLSFYCEVTKLRHESTTQKNDVELEVILKLETTNDVCLWMQRMLNETQRQLSSIKESKNSHIIENVKNIVQTQYNKFIDVASISAQVYMSQNYLRTIFKEQTGKSLSDYITDLRISKACHLLTKSKYKISEIPEQVGLHNNPHFFFLFKKYTGDTPSEYRMKYGDQNTQNDH